MMVMTETLPLAEVKAKLSEMVDRVERTHDRITVTRNGRPAAVLISPDELESLEETLDLLSEPGAIAQLRDAKDAVEAGDYMTAEDLRAKYMPGDGKR
jgi:antitoxin YefM